MKPGFNQLFALFTFACGPALSVHAAPNAIPERPPNIIVLLADDLGYAELGCQGNKDIPTPNIDSIARNGVRFTNGYVSAPVCCPSRAGLMTGRYQTRFGHEFNLIGSQNRLPDLGLPLKEKTLAERLKGAGYATALVGKWHLGGTEKFHPQQRGFDEFYGFLHEGHYFTEGPPWPGVLTWLRTNAVQARFEGRRQTGDVIWSTHMGNNEPPYDEDNPLMRGTERIHESEYLTEAFTREAVKFIDSNRTKPFFLYLAYNAVHSPMQAPPKYLNRFQNIEDVHRRIFAGMLSSLDDSVGSILEKLRGLGLEENTLIFFLSDNGGPTKELTSGNQPLRGGKGQVWEGGIRIPFLLQWPRRVRAGGTFEKPVISLDITATALAACGEPEPPQQLDGVDLIPYLRGERNLEPHSQLFWRYGGSFALRMGSWKLIRQPEKGAPNQFALFNLSSDISETFDLSNREPDRLSFMKQAWEGLNHQMVEPLWGGVAKPKK